MAFVNIKDYFSFTQHVIKPTDSAGHTLDLVFTYSLTINNLKVVVFSDHKVIPFNVSCVKEEPSHFSTRHRRTYLCYVTYVVQRFVTSVSVKNAL